MNGCSLKSLNLQVELSFRTGDIITVFGEMDDDGFYMAELRGQRGLVPRYKTAFSCLELKGLIIGILQRWLWLFICLPNYFLSWIFPVISWLRPQDNTLGRCRWAEEFLAEVVSQWDRLRCSNREPEPVSATSSLKNSFGFELLTTALSVTLNVDNQRFQVFLVYVSLAHWHTLWGQIIPT